MYKLVICDDEGKTTIVPLIRDEITIGRKEGNTIRLTERNVSRNHARLVREGDEAFRLDDLGSRCGTKINGELLRDASRRIDPRDQIAIGDYSLTIRTDVQASVPLGRQMASGTDAGIGKITPYARLVLLSEPEPGREFELTTNLYVIGRSSESNLRIDDPSLSRAHARIDGDEGKWTISDLDSINGILVNGLKRDDYLLKPGDVVELGTVRLRFVAPGEPYDFRPEEALPSVVPPQPRPRSRRLRIWLIGAVAGLALLVVLAVVLLQGGVVADPDGADKAGQDDALSWPFSRLISEGKARMQAEEWQEAARLFALAQQKDPESKVARELKMTSLGELEAQSSYSRALSAIEAKDWKTALDLFGAIPRSSQYFDLEQVRQASSARCQELATQATTAHTAGQRSELASLQAEAAALTEAPESCRGPIAALKIADAPRRPGGFVPTIGPNGEVVPPPSNPYDAPERPATPPPPVASNAPGPGFNPVAEANAALARGDRRTAIAILEQSGKSRAVLAMLAKLYLEGGDQARYQKTARTFIKLYPNDPQSAAFKSSLE